MNISGQLRIKVVPGSSKEDIAGWLGEDLKVRVRATPEKGRANSAVVTLLADVLGIPKRDLKIISGTTSTFKVLQVVGLSDAEIKKRLSSADA